MIGSAIALRAAFGLAALLASAAMPLQAQTDPAATYPNKPIRLIVPFAAGGGNDIFARLVGQKLGEIIGQTLVIENRPAAGGRVAGASGVMSISAAVYPKLSYHPTKNFVPLSMIANFPLIMVSPINNPAKTVKDLVLYAKANPNKSNYGTTSPAFTISSELLKLKTGMPGVAIPLKSSNEMILCVAAENCLFSIADGPPTIPMVKGDKVRALAVTGAERSPELPDVPSMAESGFPEVNTKLWSGFFAAAGTPPSIVKKLEAGLQRAIRDPDVSAKLKGMAVNPGGNTSDEFRKIIDADIENYVAVVKAADLKFEQ
jgi:tripartite-type tricarboxylate transporter receptor subunit TctC